ncbi:hypothetical protein IW248_002367 [Micromonospora ureilytica]|uniref:Uncharacterized protein n=1 Tax=Micromonospora ureilytica TaxID=709868 RepID=A0ABS0JG78_9ACTN|nr:hypothetical protein [Micromonospora ureilytica]
MRPGDTESHRHPPQPAHPQRCSRTHPGRRTLAAAGGGPARPRPGKAAARQGRGPARPRPGKAAARQGRGPARPRPGKAAARQGRGPARPRPVAGAGGRGPGAGGRGPGAGGRGPVAGGRGPVAHRVAAPSDVPPPGPIAVPRGSPSSPRHPTPRRAALRSGSARSWTVSVRAERKLSKIYGQRPPGPRHPLTPGTGPRGVRSQHHVPAAGSGKAAGRHPQVTECRPAAGVVRRCSLAGAVARWCWRAGGAVSRVSCSSAG